MPSEAEVKAQTDRILSKLVGQKIVLPVTDKRCIKCGCVNNVLRYIAADRVDTFPGCEFVGQEHFHRWCNRCSYSWTTNDVLEENVDG